MLRNLLAVALLLTLVVPCQAEQKAPNIVWIVVEDMSANFGCYGEKTIATPNVDSLAAEGIKFINAVTTAPVCSTCRSALITGMYQTTIGAHHHRSGRGEKKIHLPDSVTPVPRLFQQAGYLAMNLSFDDFIRDDEKLNKANLRIAKTDYNFEWDESIYDQRHWSLRQEGQPFFCQVQLQGGKLRGHGDSERWPQRVARTLGTRTMPEAVELPPYLPDDPVIREDWAQYLDTVRYTDWQVGQILERLRNAGEAERTVVVFLTDHGVSHVRNKQFCYDGGVHIPMIIHGPGIARDVIRDDPVEQIDLAATSLALAGAIVPSWMQGRDVLAKDYIPRQFGVSARDRCDETVDRIRSLRTPHWKYIRNFYPDQPYLQPNRYKDDKPIVKAMRRLAEEKKLNEFQSKIMAVTRPVEELYDLSADPHESTNLAGQAEHAETLARLRQSLADWIKWSGDRGQYPESMEMYDSDMAVYLEGLQRRDPDGVQVIQANIQQMKALLARKE